MQRFIVALFCVLIVLVLMAGCAHKPTNYVVIRVTDNTLFGSPAEKLEAYLSNSYTTSAGMCDGMRTTFMRLKGNEVIGIQRMTVIAPPSNRMYYSVKRNSGKEEFFIKTADGGGKVVVEQKASPMEWSMPLMQESPNYFIYHFYGNEKHNDCSESKQ